jgi:hypothetical protein
MPRRIDLELVQRLVQAWRVFFIRRCLAGFPWFWPAQPPGFPVMKKARSIVRRHFAHDHSRMYRLLARIFVAFAWPPSVIWNCYQIRRFRGPVAVPLKRVPNAIWAAMRYNVLPGEYFAYQLWLPDRAANIDNYLYSNEAPRLFSLINRPMRPDPIADKLAFYEMCQAHAVPTPEILAVFPSTPNLPRFHGALPPECDLFVKPRFGTSGSRAERFRWKGDTFESNRGYQIGRETLSARVEDRAYKEKEDLVVQPALLNHPDLRLRADEALATVRIVTGISNKGIAIPIFGFIYFPRVTRVTAQYGFVTLIDVTSGQLTSTPRSMISGEQHPYVRPTGDPHVPWILPHWTAVFRYLQAAHLACSNYVFVGWDLAFTPSGPMLLEGNANWSADEYQCLAGRPLGFTEFVDILKSEI